MRPYFAATCATPVILLATAPAAAETLVSSARGTAIQTSTAASGAADDVRITSDGSVKPGSGAAVTVDSDNKANNQGTIQITGADGAVGILALPGLSGGIANSGTITIDEDYTATDGDGDGDVDGTFAVGSARYGIRLAPGGAFGGDVAHSGTITVEGNGSAGIALDSGLAGNLTSSGTIAVTGDQSYGIHASAISGNVAISGSISTFGANTIGVALDGDIGGALTFQGTLSATGYRSTAAPSDTTKLDADDLLQGGAAIRISGNVAGGILFDIPPVDADSKNDDEDGDGTADASEGSASITSFGAAPAVAIGSATRDTVIGAVAGTAAAGNGLVVKGVIAASGIYSGVDATALTVAGLGGKVDIAGGILVSGTVRAGSLDADATAVRIGSGAMVPVLASSGVIVATGGAAAASRVEAVSVEAGAELNAIVNSGSIGAKLLGADGIATAIADRSGSLSSVVNSGAIQAALTTGGSAIAIDLSANTSGAMVSQIAPASSSSGTPLIVGDILFGAGDDWLDLATGAFTGTAEFGAGDNRLTLGGNAVHTGALRFGAGSDSISLSGTSSHSGDVDFGGGADTLSIADSARFSGAVSNAGQLAVVVSGGSIDLTNAGSAAIGSLSIGSGGALTVTLDGATGTHNLYDVAGQASFAPGARVNLALTSLPTSFGSFEILRGGTLVGAESLTSTGAAIPYLFDTHVSVDQTQGTISLQVDRKTAAELGLNRSGAAAYDAVYAALGADAQLGSVFLGIQDQADFDSAYRQLLPDHAGGVFAMVTEGSRALSRILADPDAPLLDMGGWGFYLNQAAWGSNKGVGDTAAWRITGWGASGGMEIKTGLGDLGLSIGYLSGFDKSGDNLINSNQFELAGYWRTDWGHLHAYARASGAYVTLDSQRNFAGTANGIEVARRASGQWNGVLLSASGGLSYRLVTGRLSLRPSAAFDYYRLDEHGWTESGGGGFDLGVDSRTSDALAANATVALGYDLQKPSPSNSSYLRLELEAGRREMAGGSLGPTVARFTGGQDFTLAAEDLRSSWIGRARLLGGNGDFQLSGEAGAEREQDRTALSGRVSLQVRF